MEGSQARPPARETSWSAGLPTAQGEFLATHAARRGLEESVRLSLLRYTDGLSNYIEVLDAEQQLFPAQTTLAQVERISFSSVPRACA